MVDLANSVVNRRYERSAMNEHDYQIEDLRRIRYSNETYALGSKAAAPDTQHRHTIDVNLKGAPPGTTVVARSGDPSTTIKAGFVRPGSSSL